MEPCTFHVFRPHDTLPARDTSQDVLETSDLGSEKFGYQGAEFKRGTTGRTESLDPGGTSGYRQGQELSRRRYSAVDDLIHKTCEGVFMQNLQNSPLGWL